MVMPCPGNDGKSQKQRGASFIIDDESSSYSRIGCRSSFFRREAASVLDRRSPKCSLKNLEDSSHRARAALSMQPVDLLMAG